MSNTENKGLISQLSLFSLSDIAQSCDLPHPTVVQLNISAGGLPKLPIESALAGRLGLEGDGHAHPKFHGGPTRAVLLITLEGIDELCAAGLSVAPGAMGENLTIRGIPRQSMRIGQRYQAGECILELTSVRVPCRALDACSPGLKRAVYDRAVKSGDAASPKWGLSGFYASVVQPGLIRANDKIAIVSPSR